MEKNHFAISLIVLISIFVIGMYIVSDFAINNCKMNHHHNKELVKK